MGKFLDPESNRRVLALRWAEIKRVLGRYAFAFALILTASAIYWTVKFVIWLVG
jgi:hypothetical protein